MPNRVRTVPDGPPKRPYPGGSETVSQPRLDWSEALIQPDLEGERAGYAGFRDHVPRPYPA